MKHLPRFISSTMLAGILVLGSSAFVFAMDHKDMALVPNGEFTMGSPGHSDETPHQVVLDAYHIDKFEVSNKRSTKNSCEPQATRHRHTGMIHDSTILNSLSWE